MPDEFVAKVRKALGQPCEHCDSYDYYDRPCPECLSRRVASAIEAAGKMGSSGSVLIWEEAPRHRQLTYDAALAALQGKPTQDFLPDRIP